MPNYSAFGWPEVDKHRSPRKKNAEHENEYALGAFVTTFLGVFFFTLALGILVPINSNVCRVDEDGVCYGCQTCGDDNKRYGVEAGMYREYTPMNVLVLALAAGVLRFVASLAMGRWATASMDWTTDIALGFKNLWYGDHKSYWKIFLANSAAYIFASLVSVGILFGINEGPRDLGLATTTLRGSGEAGGNSRSILSVLFVSIFGTLFFLWSRVKYVDGSVDRRHKHYGEKASKGDAKDILEEMSPLSYYVSVWPEISRHYATAFFNGATYFATTLVTCYYIGPAPLQLWHVLWVTIFSAIHGEGAMPDDYPDTTVSRGWHFGLFIGGAFVRILVPGLLFLYVWAQGLANSRKLKKEQKDSDEE